MTQDPSTIEAAGFDFSAPAELYIGRGSPRRHGLRFKQFDTAGEAIRYAMERPRAIGEVATMECDDKRFGAAEIAGLYHDPAYPLSRLTAAAPIPAERPSIAVPSARTQKNDPTTPRYTGASRGEVVATAAPVQRRHRYKMGMRLLMTPGGMTVSRQASQCKVTFVLPFEGGQLLYRVRSDIEAFERVVTEADLSPIKNGG